jgi:hypothetical protein
MAMNKIILTFIIILSNFEYSFSSNIPLESLLKNSNNQPIQKNTAILNIEVNVKNLSEINEDNVEDNKIYLKSIIHQSESKNIDIYNFIYSKSSMNPQDIIYFYKLPNLNIITENKINDNSKYKTNNHPPMKNLFYSSLTSFCFNRSNEYKNYFKQFSSEFISNEDAINKDLMDLLNKYKNYLDLIKNNPELKNKVTSPISSKTQEEQNLINELLNQRFYINFNKANLVKTKNEFRWEYKIDKFTLNFDTNKHQLKSILFENNSNESPLNFLFEFKEYTNYNGAYQMPKIITSKSLTLDKIFIIRNLSLNYKAIKSKYILRYINSIRKNSKIKKDINLEEIKANYPLIL